MNLSGVSVVLGLVVLLCESSVLCSQTCVQPRAVKLDKSGFHGHGIKGTRAFGGSPNQRVNLYGVDKTNDFPCRGYTIVSGNDELKVHLSLEDRDTRIEKYFQNEEELFETLRSISKLNSYSSGYSFSPKRTLEIQRKLTVLGKKKAFLAVQEFERLRPTWWQGDGVANLTRFLFKQKPEREIVVHRIEQNPDIPEELKMVFPDYPIVSIKGFPFLLSHGYLLGGDRGVSFRTIEDLDSLPSLLTERPANGVSVNEILEAFDDEKFIGILSFSRNQEAEIARKKLIVCQILTLICVQDSLSRSIRSEVIAGKLEPSEAVRLISSKFGTYKWSSWDSTFQNSEGEGG